MSQLLTLGVVATSRKENEQRVPIHPDHFEQIPAELSKQLVFETGYGVPFGLPDGVIAQRFGGVASRTELMKDLDIVLLPKPMPEDLVELREGRILWGWPHCVQQQAITQTAIDRRLTLLAFEAMFAWNKDVRGMHLFYRNNEMAGYCGVLHALGLTGIDGAYGPPLRAVVLSFGSVSRGGIAALRARGIEQITVFTQRPPYLVQEQILGCRYGQMMRDGATAAVIDEHGVKRPMIDVLAEADVIVNGILQDTDRPLMFFGEGEHRRLKNGALIVDVSCDLRMGFPFARPTSFEEPVFTVDQVTYTAVDHTPTYAWRSASWEISRVIVPYLSKVLSGPDAWQADDVLRRAVEMREGKILNDKIFTFQKRDREYPHVSHA